MTSTLQQVLLDHVQAGYAHDMHATLATLHSECVFEDTATGQVFNGREGAARHYRQWWDAFNLDYSRGEQGSGRWTTDSSSEILASEDQGTLEALISRGAGEGVEDALVQLPREFAESLELHDIERFKYREMAEIMEAPLGTVMSRIARGLLAALIRRYRPSDVSHSTDLFRL